MLSEIFKNPSITYTWISVIGVITSIVSSQIINQCRGRMNGVIFPDETNCESYYRCDSNLPTRLICPEGTLFDLKLFYCVAEHNVYCGNRLRPPPKIIIPPSPDSHHAVCQNVRNGTLIENPLNCRAFIECQGNLRLDRECRSGTLFDVRNRECRRETNVDCGRRKIEKSNEEVIIANACLSRRNGEFVVDPRNCRRYLECFFSRPIIPRTCPIGLLFDDISRKCIPAAFVRCGNRLDDRNSISGGMPDNICGTLPNGSKISDPDDCQRFYECRNGQKFDLICAPNFLFDINIHECRPNRLVDCGNRGSVDVGRRSSCVGQTNGRLIENPNNCRSYFQCNSGQAIERECEFGYLFNSEYETCDEAHLVTCGRRIIPSEDSLAPEDYFPQCPKRGIIYRNNPQDCSGYVICNEGVLTQHFCPQGQHFNRRTTECDTPENANCLASRIVNPQTPVLPDCSGDDEFFPDLGNCQRYFECEDGEPKMKTCGIGMVWDNTWQTCTEMNPNLCKRPGF